MCYTENFSAAPHSVTRGSKRLLGTMSASLKAWIQTLKNTHQPIRTVHREGERRHCQFVESPLFQQAVTPSTGPLATPIVGGYLYRGTRSCGLTLPPVAQLSVQQLVDVLYKHTHTLYSHTHTYTVLLIPPSLSLDVRVKKRRVVGRRRRVTSSSWSFC